MADPFSIGTGVAGLIGLAASIISQCYCYGCAVANAPDEARRLVSEVTSLNGILLGVRGVAAQVDLPEYQLESALKNCQVVLEKVSTKLQKFSLDSSKSSGKRAINRLLWPLRKNETEDLIAAVERHKNSLSLSLNSLSVEALMSQSANIEAVSETLAEIKSSKEDQERRDVLHWLCEHQYEAQFQRAYQLHCKNTCKWLLHDPAFLDWSKSRSSLLWMHGAAGCGKTVATTFLIHHLLERQPVDSLLAYFYYDASTIESLTPQTFFGAIVKQFCSNISPLPSEIMDAYRRASSRLGTPSQPSLLELKSFLQLLLQTTDSATVVIDGLDESSDYSAVCDFLTSMVRGEKHALRVFISSRPEVDLRRSLAGFRDISVQEEAIEQDISVYIKMRIHNDPRLGRMRDDMKDFVEATLRTDSNGMFRWVQCQLDEMSRLRTVASVKRALTQLPVSLEGSYLRIVDSIAREDIPFATRTLMWLAHASTPLTLPELAEAVVLEPDFDELDPDSKLHDPNEVLDICRSLIAYNPVSQTARLAHHSVREFLTGRLDPTSQFFIPAPSSHRTIAEACIRYLLLDDFSAGPLFRPDFMWTLSNFPLLRYAAQNWTFHVQSSGAEAELVPLIRRLMTTRSNPKFLFWLQVVLFDSWHGYVPPNTDIEAARPLYYAASYGLTETVRSLANAGANLNERAGRFGGTALHAAVWRKRPEVIDILLDAGADPTIRDYNGATPADLSLVSGTKLHERIYREKRNKGTLSVLLDSVLRLRDKEHAVSTSRSSDAVQERDRERDHQRTPTLKLVDDKGIYRS
ncbi:ankyrin repeat protein [Fonsecaea pedrosoi]|nr:ankyrin repeat protein [Fonsecaea pedrosoi]